MMKESLIFMSMMKAPGRLIWLPQSEKMMRGKSLLTVFPATSKIKFIALKSMVLVINSLVIVLHNTIIYSKSLLSKTSLIPDQSNRE